jgi:hypothetical protein
LFDHILREMVLFGRVIHGGEGKTPRVTIDSNGIKNADMAEGKGYDAEKRLQG